MLVQVMSRYVRFGQFSSGYVRIDQVMTRMCMLQQVRSGYEKLGQVRLN